MLGAVFARDLLAPFDEGMGRLPQFLRDDGLVLAGVPHATVADLTQVDAVAQQREQELLVDGAAGALVAALGHPGLGGVALDGHLRTSRAAEPCSA